MPISVRRQRRVTSLENHCLSLQSEINSLGKDLLVTADPLCQLRLQKAIATKEKELHECWSQLRKLKAQPVWDSLASMDYYEQVRLFRRLMEASPVGAVLLHGDIFHGHHCLLDRMLKTVPGYGSVSPAIVNCGAYTARRDDALPIIQEIGRSFGVSLARNSVTSRDVVDRVANSFKTKSVLIVLKYVNCLDDLILTNLLSEFWNPLATKACDIYCDDKFDRRNHLYLFLTDHRQSPDNVSAMWTDDLSPSWKPQQAVRMPVLSRFTPQAICDWINNNLDYLPAGLLGKDPEHVSLEIIEETAGVPETVFDHLCKLCDIDFWEGGKLWT